MKKWILILTLVSGIAHANPTGEFVLGTDPTDLIGSSHCAVRTQMILDESPIMGMILHLEDYVEGKCKIKLFPNPRTLRLTEVGRPCGSIEYSGYRVEQDGTETVFKVLDHRTRVCEDYYVADIEVITSNSQKEISHLYSLQKMPEYTCSAFWEGYTIDPIGKRCVASSTSACSNPYKYQTLDSCEAVLKNGIKMLQ